MLPQTAAKQSSLLHDTIKWDTLMDAAYEPFDMDEQRCAHIKLARRHTVTWDQISACGVIYPQYAQRAVTTIQSMLGYLPFPTIYLPHEVFIRTLIADFENGQLPAEAFLGKLRSHVSDIRNDEMRTEGVAENPVYSEADLAFYHAHLAEYKQDARDRIVALLGYEPSLHHSLYAEMLLRDLLEKGTSNAVLTPQDCKAVTVVKFREHIAAGGIVAANLSPLIQWKE
jgi:hypothetical protein